MIYVKSVHPPGVVIVPSSNLSRYVEFASSLDNLKAPLGTQIVRIRSMNVTKNLNEGVRVLMGLEEHGWAWLLGDDHTFSPDCLLSLLDRDVEVVQPVICQSGMPFNLCLFKAGVMENERQKWVPYAWAELADLHGLVLVYASGLAGMLVRRPVFEKIGDPWFEMGHYNPEEVHEDVYFCEKIRTAGFPIYLDTDISLGHISPAIVMPMRDQATGEWIQVISWGGDDPKHWIKVKMK